MRLKLTLEYDGTGFRGWAAQPGHRTVEGVLRDALDAVYGSWDGLAVAGRTDAGVHALCQVASVEAAGGPPVERAAEALSTGLPDDVSVLETDHAFSDRRLELAELTTGWLAGLRSGDGQVSP